ncbi:MAG: aryl-sulfate sulfotransferase [Gammaproteobacteria bacterium]|nr:aryl-sulfate sulfotransferase [Gammaproteobacteria bacterium]
MSRISAWIVWLAVLIAMAACQGPTASEDASTTAAHGEETPAPDAASAEESSATDDDEDAEFQQFLALGRLDAQRGLLEKTEAATSGYVLFNPLKSATAYMIDKDGQVVHTWRSELGVGGGVYLRDNGNLFRPARNAAAPTFAGGGQGGWFQEYTWDGEVVWEYRFGSEDFLPHHDVAFLPNGNFLAIAWETRTVKEAVALGRDPEAIPEAGLWPDWIFEMKPVGSNDAEIVWEWHLWDHVVQDFDETKDNYGAVADHPELLDINAGHLPEPITQEEVERRKAADLLSTNKSAQNWGADMYHMNGINYNAELDQIAFSVLGISEVFIIDHSTTIEEAAGHTGGRWGKGGDILYRWGNPANYGRGDESDQRLGEQHDVQWIPPGRPGAGNLTVFNNQAPGVGPAKSAVFELQTPLTDTGYVLSGSSPYGPEEPVWHFMAENPMEFFSPFISGANRMPNGNTMIAEGASGRFLEVDPNGNVVWSYMTPYAGYLKNPDGTSPQPVGPLVYATFRATHIPIDHPGLAGRDLKPLDPQPPAYVPPEQPAPAE